MKRNSANLRNNLKKIENRKLIKIKSFGRKRDP